MEAKSSRTALRYEPLSQSLPVSQSLLVRSPSAEAITGAKPSKPSLTAAIRSKTRLVAFVRPLWSITKGGSSFLESHPLKSQAGGRLWTSTRQKPVSAVLRDIYP